MILESWYDQDVNMPVVPKKIVGRLFNTDGNANRIGVRIWNGNEPNAIEAGSVCVGNIYRADGYNVAVNGTIDGNKAYFDIPSTGYAVVGRVVVTVIVSKSGNNTTVLCLTGTVVSTSDGMYIDPDAVDYTQVIALLAQLEDAITAAQGVIASSVRYDISQSLTDAQKLRARQNIASALVSPADSESSGTGMLVEY